jgi:hypothetical protein
MGAFSEKPDIKPERKFKINNKIQSDRGKYEINKASYFDEKDEDTIS